MEPHKLARSSCDACGQVRLLLACDLVYLIYAIVLLALLQYFFNK